MLFFSANVLIYTLHELSHALTAYFLGIDSMLFHLYANFNKAAATTTDTIVIAIAGPVSSLFTGIISWFIYKKSTNTTLKLFSLYATIFGIDTFFGNLFSTAFGGDFNQATTLMGISSTIQLVATFSGITIVGLFMYKMGKELLKFRLDGATVNNTIAHTIIIPSLLGTCLIMLAYLPLPGYLITGIIASTFFWIFSLIGAYRNKKEIISVFKITPIHWSSILLFLISIAIVRSLVYGIHFTP